MDTAIVQRVSAPTSARMSMNKDVTTINIDHHIDNAGTNSANISLSIPRHSYRQYFKYNRTVVKPMMEIEVFFKGRFLDEHGAPQYYQVFWGLITTVGVEYSNGSHTLNLSCMDILHFWDMTRVNTNPSGYTQAWDRTAQMTQYATIFNHLTPFEIITTLAWVTMGTLIPPSVSVAVRDAGAVRAVFGQENVASMNYWAKRNRAIAKRLRMISMSSSSLQGVDRERLGTLAAYNQKNQEQLVKELLMVYPKQGPKRYTSTQEIMARSNYHRPMNYMKLDGDIFESFMPFNQAGTKSDVHAGENESRLIIANKAKDTIGFEFYMDVNGDIVFKPPFYNMEVRTNDPISVIRDEDIISMSTSDNSQALYTSVEVTGSYTTYSEDGDKTSLPHAAHIDYVRAREFGIKHLELTRNFLISHEDALIFAISELSRANAKRFTANITIIGRPELRLGFPVFIESMDTYYYVVGISHAYSADGKLETTLQLEGARRKYIQYDDKGHPINDSNELVSESTLRPVIKGSPNIVLVPNPQVPKETLERIIKEGEEAFNEFKSIWPDENIEDTPAQEDRPLEENADPEEGTPIDDAEKKTGEEEKSPDFAIDLGIQGPSSTPGSEDVPGFLPSGPSSTPGSGG